MVASQDVTKALINQMYFYVHFVMRLFEVCLIYDLFFLYHDHLYGLNRIQKTFSSGNSQGIRARYIIASMYDYLVPIEYLTYNEVTLNMQSLLHSGNCLSC